MTPLVIGWIALIALIVVLLEALSR